MGAQGCRRLGGGLLNAIALLGVPKFPWAALPLAPGRGGPSPPEDEAG